MDLKKCLSKQLRQHLSYSPPERERIAQLVGALERRRVRAQHEAREHAQQHHEHGVGQLEHLGEVLARDDAQRRVLREPPLQRHVEVLRLRARLKELQRAIKGLVVMSGVAAISAILLLGDVSSEARAGLALLVLGLIAWGGVSARRVRRRAEAPQLLIDLRRALLDCAALPVQLVTSTCRASPAQSRDTAESSSASAARRKQLLLSAQGTRFSALERAFCKRSSRYHARQRRAWYRQGPEARRARVRVCSRPRICLGAHGSAHCATRFSLGFREPDRRWH